ncbi:Trm112 family protein [Gallibacterium anatis]|uniref:Trm112 family protein n=1 Tax=Gallibacterium anatis TaxID=750 RepID=UPI002231A235|nr:Trm112 family protein [Gallibacterium anatis]UZD16147.1 Trm112 family protein [Gallibacterium anatis]
MKQKVINMLACPYCHQPLSLDEQQQRLICENEQLAYPIVNGIPALLPENAVELTQDNQTQAPEEA